MTERLNRAKAELIANDINGLLLYRGLSPEIAEQVVKKSRQKHIKAATPKDFSARFASVESVLERQATRETYALIADQDLAGIAWYGEKPFPIVPDDPAHGGTDILPNHTFGIRMYNRYKGKGLAKPLMDRTLLDYMNGLALNGTIDNFRGIWLSTHYDNPARQLYTGYGYKEVAFAAQEVIMVLPITAVTERIGALSSVG